MTDFVTLLGANNIDNYKNLNATTESDLKEVKRKSALFSTIKNKMGSTFDEQF